ncbi:MAG: hypothetical protein FWG80_01585 [Alphaproteobacteria bacterium]|nr:hypothetical protein [Alphaproteobacteria bacterium]
MSNELFIPDFIEINGGRPIDGTIKVSGAKNEILGAMAACLLTDEVLTLTNVPHISDVLDMGKVLINLGVRVEYDPATGILCMQAKTITSNRLSAEAGKFRASYYLWGPLLARFRHTREFDSLHVEIPGGCGNADARGIDYHVNLLKTVLDAKIEDSGSAVDFFLPTDSTISNGNIYSTVHTSHGSTFHWMLTVSILEYLNLMYNATLEPEIPALLQLLNNMGAKLRGMGSTALHSYGHKGLLRGGTFEIMPDRLEAGSYACLAFGTRGKLRLENIDPTTCRPWLNFLYEMGDGKKNIQIEDNSIYFDFSNRPDFEGRVLHTSPYPGKETDLQQVFVPLLAGAKGRSIVTDLNNSWRDQQLPQMRQFGIDCDSEFIATPGGLTKGQLKIFILPSEIKPTNTVGSDLRGTFGIIECAAIANGQSRIENPGNAFRGYPNFLAKLQNIGIDVTASETGKILSALPEINRQ